jgi:hypothetical protein
MESAESVEILENRKPASHSCRKKFGLKGRFQLLTRASFRRKQRPGKRESTGKTSAGFSRPKRCAIMQGFAVQLRDFAHGKPLSIKAKAARIAYT